ncbi:hypothetical protein EDC04DRAFT_2638898 [Pisolithus marmoratus]|nr:hypothetical protein EDC04DRAFT_2638898 [Pisolithus marmoratus]
MSLRSSSSRREMGSANKEAADRACRRAYVTDECEDDSLTSSDEGTEPRAPSSPVLMTGAAHNESPSYRKHNQSASPHVAFMEEAQEGLSCSSQSADEAAGEADEEADRKARQKELEKLPRDVLREVVKARYADCEATRYRVLTTAWEIDKHERWKHFFDRSFHYLEHEMNKSKSEIESFKKCLVNMGADHLPEEEVTILRETLEEDTLALSIMQKDFKETEEVAIYLGILDDSKGSVNHQEPQDSSSGAPHHSELGDSIQVTL